jgi:hypothetical protein
MNQGVRYTEELLVLTCTPKDTNAVIEWRPFRQGNTLGQIITAHNLRCDGILQERTPKEFIDCLPEIKPALTIGSCLAEDSDRLDGDRLGRVKILLLDLDSEEHNLQRMEPIRQQLSKIDQMFYLIQVSRSSRPVSWAGFFGESSHILRTEPEVFTKQSEIEKFLHRFRGAYENGWAGVIRNPLDAPCLERSYNEPYVHPSRGHFINPDSREGKSIERIYRTYRSKYPNLVSSVRDTAIARQLPDDQVVNLGRTAAIQELLLTLIAERARPSPVSPVSVSPIRLPLMNIPVMQPIELNNLRKAQLLGVHRLKPIQQLDESQIGFLEELGMKYGVPTAIHNDHPEIWERIEQMGDIVKGDKFTAELPDWPVEFTDRQVELNEFSFGLDIKESLLGEMEVP